MSVWGFCKKLIGLVFPPSHHAKVVASTTTNAFLQLEKKVQRENVVALFPYRNEVVRAAIWQAKYRRDERALHLLGAALADYIEKHSPENTVVVPIPLHKKRLRERGYNQVELVAKELLQYLPNVRVRTDILTRIRNTPPQTKLRRAERLLNMKGAFKVERADLSPDTPLLLLDDITTTGTTLREAKDTLKKAGFINVRCVAIGC